MRQKLYENNYLIYYLFYHMIYHYIHIWSIV